MLIGYARVSTQEQTLALQQDALQQLGCEHIFNDTASGAQTDRPGLDQALHYVRAGWILRGALDRLYRTTNHHLCTKWNAQQWRVTTHSAPPR